jgi:hypothetical protein
MMAGLFQSIKLQKVSIQVKIIFSPTSVTSKNHNPNTYSKENTYYHTNEMGSQHGRRGEMKGTNFYQS